MSGRFSESAQIPESLKTMINERLTPLFKRERPTLARRCEYAAWILEWQQATSLEIGRIYLQAAWYAVRRPQRASSTAVGTSEQGEEYYRRRAVTYFERAICDTDLSFEDKAKTTYLIGELYRRVGEPDKAAQWYERVAEVVGDDSETRWLVDAAEQQRTNPKDRFETCYPWRND